MPWSEHMWTPLLHGLVQNKWLTMRNPSRAGIFLLSGCDHMITFFHVIISLLPGLGNTAAGRLRHPGGDWQGGSRDEGGDQNSKISLRIWLPGFLRLRPKV